MLPHPRPHPPPRHPNAVVSCLRQVYVCGLAFDFCCAFTAKDAVAAGFAVHFIADACRAITAEGRDAATADLAAVGVSMITADMVPVAADYH